MSVVFGKSGNLKTSHTRQITIPPKIFRIFCSFLTLWLTMAFLAYAQNMKPAEDPGGETPTGGGTIYYVSSSQGKDSNNGRSREAPWSTLSKVTKTSFKPGDSILFKRGDVWKGQVLKFTSSGKSGDPITYGAYGTGKRPVIQGGSSVDMQSQSWVVIDRLHFHNGKSMRIASSSHIKLSNSEISHRDRTCLRVFGYSKHILIERNKIHDCGYGSNGKTKKESGVNGEGMYIGTSVSSKGVDKTGFVTIRANDVYDTTDEGINIKEHTHDILVEGNVVHDLVTSDPGGINLRPVVAKNHVVRNNIVYNIKGHPRAGSKAGTGIVTGEGSEVYNNISFGNQAYGIRVMSGAKVYHNTLCDNGSGAVDIDGKNVDVRNNIGPRSEGNIPDSKDLFVDIANGDFRLRKGSSAIDAASDVDIYVDKMGTTRPQGAGFDYGAYELTSATTSPKPPKRLRLGNL